MSDTFSIGITGCTGRIGSLLVQELRSGKWDAQLAGGSEVNMAERPITAIISSPMIRMSYSLAAMRLSTSQRPLPQQSMRA